MSDEGDSQNGNSNHICASCAADSRRQLIHCIRIAAPKPALPSYQSAMSVRSGNPAVAYRSNNPAVPVHSDNPTLPVLRIETSHVSSLPSVAHSATRINTNKRSQVRLHRSGASPASPRTTFADLDGGPQVQTSGFSIPNTPQDGGVNCVKRSKLGLGLQIPETPFNPAASPIRSPGSERLVRAEKGEHTEKPLNVAKKIEEKLVDYGYSGNATKQWLFEILSWIVSALSMAAIIIALFVLSGEPAPTNWPLGLTLNTYISILSKIASAALVFPATEAIGQLKWGYFQGKSRYIWDFEVFDNASRGPWGSLLLIFQIKGKGTTLAALGSSIVILAIVLDPFFQQVVHYPQSWELHSGEATLPKVTHYQPGWAKAVGIGQTLFDHNRDVQRVLDEYFFDYGIQEVQIGNTTRPDIPISCPSSNCTWEPYETLGICSQCVDVADRLDFRCRQAPLDWVFDSNLYIPYDNGTVCGWFFNATGPKPILMSGYQLDPVTNQTGEILIMRSLPLLTVLNRRPLFNSSLNFQHIRNRVTDFIISSPPVGPDEDKILDSVLRHERPRAEECMLSMCVKRIESSYAFANYKEVITDHWVNETGMTQPFPWTPEPYPSPKRPDGKVYKYFQDIVINIPRVDDQENQSTYGVSNNTAYDIITVFDDYLPNFGIRQNITSKAIMKYGLVNQDFAYAREYLNNPWLFPRNASEHMKRMATSLTNIMRFSSREFVKGKAYSQNTIVAVRWQWLLLPTGLLLLTLVFLTIVIMQTSSEQSRVGVWKNSAIASLIYGLPDRYKEDLLSSEGGESPRTRAKTIRVKMLPTRDWRISGKYTSPTQVQVENFRGHEPNRI